MGLVGVGSSPKEMESKGCYTEAIAFVVTAVVVAADLDMVVVLGLVESCWVFVADATDRGRLQPYSNLVSSEQSSDLH